MSGESDLRTLLMNMTPILHEEEYGFGYMPSRNAVTVHILIPPPVIPAKAGIQLCLTFRQRKMGPCLRRGDGWGGLIPLLKLRKGTHIRREAKTPITPATATIAPRQIHGL
jgi:ACT domain